jgi:hypothetical protein
MKTAKKLCSALCMVTLLLTFFAAVSEVGSEDFETPRNRHVSEILPAFGVFRVTGDIALRKLLKEIQAIAALKEVTESEAFIKSVAEAGKKPLQFSKDLITEPTDTATGIPRGVSKLFGNIATSITETHDPSEDARYKQMLLVANYKREYAYRLGVDVYSSNEVLQKELNKVGWAAAIGSLSVSAVTAGAGSTAVSVISKLRLAKSINELQKAEPPARLRLINEEKLLKMGVSKNLAERFLNHPHFTPRHDTIIVECLRALKNAKDRPAFIESALRAEDEQSANFFQHIAETMVGYNDAVSPILEIRVIDGIVLAKAKNLSGLIPFPLDHGVWTEEPDRIFKNLVARYKSSGLTGKLELWVTGTLSPMGKQQLKQLGVEVVENVDQKIGFMD